MDRRRLSFLKKQLKDYFNYKFYRRMEGFASYSIVSACFNVSSYLDDFVNSLVRQTLDFEKNVELILVDDGSTDDTWLKIRKWAKRFPKNIIALRKKNGGPASARNYGLYFAHNEWVSFADPDDFFDLKALDKIDTTLEKLSDEKICFVSLNRIFFFESDGLPRDIHSLKFKYFYPLVVREIQYSDDYIQLSAGSLFIKREIMKDHFFSNAIKPNFEDIFFVNSLMIMNLNKKILFLKDAVYYYQKRKDGNSITDRYWWLEEKFYDVLQEGYLPLLAQAKTNYIPSFVKNVIIHELIRYCRRLKNKEELVYFLTDEQKQRFIKLFKKCFEYIEDDAILSYNREGITNAEQIELSYFVHEDSQLEPEVNITKFDKKNSLIRLEFLARKQNTEVSFSLGNKQIIKPLFVKTVINKLLDADFSYQKICWFPIETKENSVLSVKVDAKPVSLRIKGNKKNIVKVSDIVNNFNRVLENNSNGLKYKNCWLISDRDSQADDNGEHFYRYLMLTPPQSLHQKFQEINAWFVLKQDSHDWQRLQKEGFRLIPFGSIEHRLALKNCSKLISSHADAFLINPFKEISTKTVPFIFLQHGVTKDDLSKWLNPKQIDLIITATVQEKESIAGNGNRYQYTEKEVALTGFPRHDALLQAQKSEKLVLVMPTWRKFLSNSSYRHMPSDEKERFLGSAYAKRWYEFLHNPRFLQLIREKGYRILFFPHAKAQAFLKYLTFPKEIEIGTHLKYRIQEVLGKGSLMITDYSSVAFDFAYLEKPVIYYQFDRQEVFSQNVHTYQKGYFDYFKDGFGPVVDDEGELLQQIQTILSNDCKVEESYLRRMQELFPFKDGECCQRVFEEIQKL